MAAEVTAAAVTSAVVGVIAYTVADPQGSQQAMQAVLDTADLAVEGLRHGMSTVGAVVGTGLSTMADYISRGAINGQKQDGHIVGTPQYNNRIKQGQPTSTWKSADEADGLTKDTRETGTLVNSDDNGGRTYRKTDDDSVGIGPGGGEQFEVTVQGRWQRPIPWLSLRSGVQPMSEQDQRRAFQYVAWFREPHLAADDAEREWPACLIVEARSEAEARDWADALARQSERRTGRLFIRSYFDLDPWPSDFKPRLIAGQALREEDIGW